MKAFWFSVVLFIIIVGAVVGNSFYVSFLSDSLDRYTKEIENSESPAALINELQDFWNTNRKFAGLSIETPELDSVGRIIVSLRLAYEEGSEFEFKHSLLMLSEASREISRLERLSLENLF